ncbi:MAG TPA: hypothetical protein PLD23_18250 [Armatimonadota bacterium]|nr:hypothetical protein [Armatimonadota bacterium]
MKRVLLWGAGTIIALATAAAAQDAKLPYRWMYVSRNLSSDEQLAGIEDLVRAGAEHGINGMVLSADLELLDRQPEANVERLRRLRAFCDEQGVEIIPIICSAGYGGSVLARNPNLAEGIPVEDALFVAHGDTAVLEPDPPITFTNGGFEEYEGDEFAGFAFIDKPGVISFADAGVKHSGDASLRFEAIAAGDPTHGHARAMQELSVAPRRHYVVRAWVKTEDFAAADRFAIQVYAGERAIAPVSVSVPPTTDWMPIAISFNSLAYDRVRIYLGVWGGTTGQMWLDDIAVEEAGLSNVLRRPGTPIVVRGEASGIEYEEGRDFARIEDPRLGHYSDEHDGPSIQLLPGGRITDGERLRVSFYHGARVNEGQVTVCMSEPEVYEIWRDAIRRIEEVLHPPIYFLSMDEVRAGGTCAACKARGLSMAEILGDCITRQFQMIREVKPGAEVVVWSDMLDPNHNAHGDYYLVEGDFSGSWKHVPSDLIMACWDYDVRDKSLSFFSGLGFRTLGGAYYDGNDLTNPAGWIDSLLATPNAAGIMYTTWQDKYALLGGFGDLVREKAGPAE